MPEHSGDTPSQNPNFDLVMQVLRQVLSGAPPPPGGPTGRAWVVGEDTDGMTIVAVQVEETVYNLKVPDLQTLAAMVGPSLRPRRPLEEIPLPYASRTAPSLAVTEHAVPPGQSLSLVRAGDEAQAMEAIDAVRADQSGAASYTVRGPTVEAQGMEYKPINEDGVLLRVRRGDPAQGLSDWVLIGAFDQAGGEGSVVNRSGAASEAAARAFDAAMARVEQGEDPEEVLRDATRQAHAAVEALGVGAVSTLAVVLVEVAFQDGKPSRRQALAAALGDSRVLLVGKDGRLKEKTVLHNLGAQVAVGMVHDIPPSIALRFAGALSKGLGTEDIEVDVYRWPLEPGDWLVVETDGVGDAHELEESPPGQWHADRCAEAQARLLGGVSTPAQAVETLVGYALDQMAERYGKPDNIGVAVARVSPGD